MNRGVIITCLFVLCLGTMAASALAFVVSGTVSDSVGAVAGATVTIRSGTTVLGTFLTLSDGLYSFDVAAGSYTVTAAKANYRSPAALPVVVVDADVPGQNIILAELYTISGTIALSDAASPVGVKVTLLDAVANVVGTFTTLADGAYSFIGVAGSYTVNAWKPFYTTGTAGVEVSANTTVPLITLDRVATLTISGSITDGSGPVSGVKVRATCVIDTTVYYDSAASDAAGLYTTEVPDDWNNLFGYTLSIPGVPYGKRVVSAPAAPVFPTIDTPVTGQDFVLAAIQRLVDVTSDDFIALPQPRGTLTSWQNHGTLGGYFTPFGSGTTTYDVTDGLHAAKFVATSCLRLRDTSVPPTVDILMPAINTGNAPWTVSTWARLPFYVAGTPEWYFIWAPTSPAAPLPQDHIAAACNWADSGSVGAFRNSGTPPALGYGDLAWAGNIPPSVNVWHNLTLTYDGLVMSAYVDGVLNKSKTLIGPMAITANQPVNIGGRYTQITSTSSDQEFYGSIARVVMLDGATDPADVPALVASIRPADAVQYTITVTDPAPAGTITPGTTTLPAGDSQTFTIAANLGYGILDVVVDGVSKGPITSVVFTNLAANHTISATFKVVPLGTITGTVKDKNGNPIVGATIYYSGTPNASLGTSPPATSGLGGAYTLANIPQGLLYVCASATGYWTSSDKKITLGATTVVANFTLASTARNIPRPTDLLFSAITDTFPTTNGAATGDWANYLPTAQQPAPVPWPLGPFVMMTTPTVEYVDNIQWEQNQNIVNALDGYRVMGPITNWPNTTANEIACNGATVVVVARPVRDGSTNLGSLVNIFRQNLVLGMHDNTGVVHVLRNATNINNRATANASTAIPDRQKTVLSLVVQPAGDYKVYANGALIMDIPTTYMNGYGNTFYYFVPNQQGSESTKKCINIGRPNNDVDKTFNGNIGDVLVYKVALSDADRQTLETDLKAKFGIVTHTITVTAGANGTISPAVAGSWIVTDGANQTFTATPATGYTVDQLIVDGSPVTPATTYTFTNVVADHTISVTFKKITFTITASAGANGSIDPVGAVTVDYGTDKTFTITPDAGYAIDDVLVDGVSDPGAVAAGSYTFINVTAAHTISATFKSAAKPVGANNKVALTDDKLVGKLIRIWGKVDNLTPPTSFTIDDGYGTPITVYINGVTLPPGLDNTSMAAVTGVLNADKSVQAQEITAYP